MKVELSVDNNYLNLCKVNVIVNRNGKKKIDREWEKVERFIANSNFAGKNNLIVSLSIDDKIIFQQTKVKHKAERYQSVFHMMERFLMDKLHFYHKLTPEERTNELDAEYKRNIYSLQLIKKVDRKMRRLM